MGEPGKERYCSICVGLLADDDDDLCMDCREEEEMDFDEMLYLECDD